MRHATIFDCEFLTAEGALSRLWSGPHDPDPVVAQIGVVRLGLEAPSPCWISGASMCSPWVVTGSACRSIPISPP